MKVRRLFRPLISFWQRGRRGWADEDMWSIYDYLGNVIPGLVASLRDDGISYACVHEEGAHGLNDCDPQGWADVLNRIEFGFRYHRWAQDHYIFEVPGAPPLKFPIEPADPNWFKEVTRREQHADAIAEEALKLMVKYWWHLWD